MSSQHVETTSNQKTMTVSPSMNLHRIMAYENNYGFSNELYLTAQLKKIKERLSRYDKVYLEFGGKLVFDYHAYRVLPGYDPNVKLELIKRLGNEAEIIMCISALDIQRNKMNYESNLAYKDQILKDVNRLQKYGIGVTSFVVTRYNEQIHDTSTKFISKLKSLGYKVYTSPEIEDLTKNIDIAISPEGFGRFPDIETHKKLVVVTAPGPGSGKLTTCLSQLYKDRTREVPVKSYYAKFETFPVWNLELDDPINIAYEAATIDLNDKNVYDTFYSQNNESVNYNRDMEAFPILKNIFERITGEKCDYNSPTEMGVNMIKEGIVNHEACKTAAREEIIRRYFQTVDLYHSSNVDYEYVQRIKNILDRSNVHVEDMPAVKAARKLYREKMVDYDNKSGVPLSTAALETSGEPITASVSTKFHDASLLIIKSIKHSYPELEKQHIIPEESYERLKEYKVESSISEDVHMNASEVRAYLMTSPESRRYARALNLGFYHKNVHFTYPPPRGDLELLQELGACVTFENYSIALDKGEI